MEEDYNESVEEITEEILKLAWMHKINAFDVMKDVEICMKTDNKNHPNNPVYLFD